MYVAPLIFLWCQLINFKQHNWRELAWTGPIWRTLVVVKPKTNLNVGNIQINFGRMYKGFIYHKGDYWSMSFAIAFLILSYSGNWWMKPLNILPKFIWMFPTFKLVFSFTTTSVLQIGPVHASSLQLCCLKFINWHHKKIRGATYISLDYSSDEVSIKLNNSLYFWTAFWLVGDSWRLSLSWWHDFEAIKINGRY